MGTTNNPGNTSTNLGDKLNSLIEPALPDLGTKIPGWGWIVGAFESIKEWFQASSDYQKANDLNIGAEARNEYKLAGDADSKLAGEEAISTVLAQTGFKPASWGGDLALMIELVTDNPAAHEKKSQKLTIAHIRKEAVKHKTSNIGLDHRNTP